jgi:hypothetical protein
VPLGIWRPLPDCIVLHIQFIGVPDLTIEAGPVVFHIQAAAFPTIVVKDATHIFELHPYPFAQSESEPQSYQVPDRQ